MTLIISLFLNICIVLCSHQFALQLYIESIKSNFLACKCEPMVDLMMGVLCFGGCKNVAVFGENCDKRC